MSITQGAVAPKSATGGSRKWRHFKRQARHLFKKVTGGVLIAIGMVFFIVGVPFALAPLHLGLPFVVVGLIMVLRNAMWARRRFIHLKRRHPNWIMPVRKLLRKKPQIASVFWQLTLKTERFFLRSRHVLGGLRRRYMRRPKTVSVSL
jgi:hypothetical protein